MSDTPRTDAEAGHFDGSGCWRSNPSGECVDIDFARQLERECNELRRELAAELSQRKMDTAELIRLAEDMLSTFRVDDKTVLVTEERVEAWRSVLSRVRFSEAGKGGARLEMEDSK